MQDENNETALQIPDSLADRRALARSLATDNGGVYIDAAVHMLIQLCCDPETEVRRLAIESLRYRAAISDLRDALGDQSVEDVVRPIIERGLDEPDAPTRLAYLSFLNTCAKLRRSGLRDLAWVVRRLIAFLDDLQREVRSACISILADLDREELYQGAISFPEIALQRSPRFGEWQRLLCSVSPLCEDAALIRRLLSQRDFESQQLGLIVASWKGSSFLGEICTLAGDPDTEVRLATIRALERVGESAIPKLAELCRSQSLSTDTYERRTAQNAVREEGLAQESPPQRENATNVRVRAIRAMGKIGRESELAFSVAMSGLRDEDPFVRIESITALRALGPSPRDVFRALIECLDDPDQRVSDASDSFIRFLLEYQQGSRHQGAESISTLLDVWKDCLTDTNNKRMMIYVAIVSCYVAQHVELDYFLPALLDTISRGMRCPERDVIYSALQAIQQLGPKAGDLVPLVEDILRRDQESLRDGPSLVIDALWALRSIGPGAANSLPTLRRILLSTDSFVRRECAITTTYVDPRANDAIGVLREILAGDDEQSRQPARFRLGQLGMLKEETAAESR